MSQNIAASTERATIKQKRPGTKEPVLAGARTERVGPVERDGMIALAAYFRAERRGFLPGQELEDWLEAEKEIERRRGGG